MTWNLRYLLTLSLLLIACLAFYAWQWWQLRPPASLSHAPEEGSPEWYRQSYREVIEQMGDGDFQQARDQLASLQAARGRPADRLESETPMTLPSDLHSNPMHASSTAGGGVAAATWVEAPIPRAVLAQPGECQLHIEYHANREAGGWRVTTSVVAPDSYEPLSEVEQGQVQQQALRYARANAVNARPGAARWGQFVFGRLECLRPQRGEMQ